MELSIECTADSTAEACMEPNSPPNSEREALLGDSRLLQHTKSHTVMHKAALTLLMGLGVLVSAYLVSRLGSRMTATSRQMMMGGFAKPLCGHSEANMEYHTNRSLQRVTNMYSKDMCCAACDGHPECQAWSWVKKQGVPGLSNDCYLKALSPGEALVKGHRDGIVSGILSHRLDVHHGLVSDGISQQERSEAPILPNQTCRGEVKFKGLGSFQVVNAEWHSPWIKGRRVDVKSKIAVIPHVKSRAYFAEGCTAGEYDNKKYANVKLLGKTISYTVDLSSVGCGCDAQVHLVPMRHNSQKSKCKDFFCGPSQKHVCGETCFTIRLQDANQYSWFTSLHLKDDPHGVSIGYGGKERRDWNSTQYGPSAKCIDTTWPFRVAVSFLTNDKGTLETVKLTLSQTKSSCNLTAQIDMYILGTRDGLSELSEAMEAGVTPVVTYWNDDSLLWMDGLGIDGSGPCVVDAPAACPRSMMLSNFAIAKSETAVLQPDMIDIAMSAIQEKMAELQAAKKEEKFIEAQRAREPCVSDCASGVGKKMSKASHKAEASADNDQWEVVFSKVPVRIRPSFKAKTIVHKTRGDMLVGALAKNWLHLRGGGFVAVKKHQRVDAIFLERRVVTYEKLSGGLCEESGLLPIHSKEMCQDAAFALGYLDTFVNAYGSVNKRPYGCYLMHGQIFFVSDLANTKNPVGKRNMICVSKAYTPNGIIEA